VTPSGGLTLSRSLGGARADLAIAIAPVNVFGVGSLEEFARAVRAAAPARLLVITGLPRAFSAGVEVADHAPEPARIERMLSAMRGVLEALVASPAVTLAAVAGACLGGGAEIAAACDLVLAAEDARIGFPEIRLACFPPGAAALLPGRVGEARAIDWILSGRIVSGREAAEAGFASRAVPGARLAAETETLAAQILAASPAALSSARGLLRGPRREALAARLPAAEDAYRALAGDADLARAVREFEARRGR
jgi:cyclohexa-1,5-dienecarbonyl-CoA hydratase